MQIPIRPTPHRRRLPRAPAPLRRDRPNSVPSCRWSSKPAPGHRAAKGILDPRYVISPVERPLHGDDIETQGAGRAIPAGAWPINAAARMTLSCLRRVTDANAPPKSSRLRWRTSMMARTSSSRHTDIDLARPAAEVSGDHRHPSRLQILRREGFGGRAAQGGGNVDPWREFAVAGHGSLTLQCGASTLICAPPSSPIAANLPRCARCGCARSWCRSVWRPRDLRSRRSLRHGCARRSWLDTGRGVGQLDQPRLPIALGGRGARSSRSTR